MRHGVAGTPRGDESDATRASAWRCLSGLRGGGAVEGLEDRVEQGEQYRLHRLTVSGVARHDRDVRVEVERVADPLLLGLVDAVGPVEADDERDVSHLAERADDADRLV